MFVTSKQTKRFQMPLSKARWRIFAVWGVSIVLYIILFEVAPVARKGVISHSQAHSGLLKILALASPVLGAYGGYYFSPEGKKMRAGTIAKERWMAAFWITILYHGILLVFLFFVLYLHDYGGSEDGVGHHDSSFEDLIANVLQLGVLFSVAATGPVAFLVGSTKVELRQRASMDSEGGSDE